MDTNLLRLMLLSVFLVFVFFLGVFIGEYYFSQALPCVSVEDTYRLYGYE